MPAMHVGMPEKFPPLDEDDLANLRKGIELFAFFVEVIPHKFQADDEGFLGTIPHEQLTTPYADRNVLEIGKGDWVVVNPGALHPDAAASSIRRSCSTSTTSSSSTSATIPDAPRRRDDGRMLAETAVRALADLKVCVAHRRAEQGRAAVPPAAAAGLTPRRSSRSSAVLPPPRASSTRSRAAARCSAFRRCSRPACRPCRRA